MSNSVQLGIATTSVRPSRNIGLGLFRFRARPTLLFIAFLFLGYANVFQTYVHPICAYIDEAIALLLALWSLITSLYLVEKKRMSGLDKLFLFLMVAFCFVGLAGNLINGLQPAWPAIAIDLFTCLKFAIAFIAVKYLRLSPEEYNDLWRLCIAAVKVSLTILLLLGLISQFFDSLMIAEKRYGIACFRFLFGHPSNFAALIAGFLALLSLHPKENALYIAMGVVLLFLTMRFKAIGFAVLLVIALVFRIGKTRSTALICFGALVALIAVSSNQVSTYYFNPNTARSALTVMAPQIAFDFFPFGSGFATYGSFVTTNYYPDFYTDLGFGTIAGLTKEYPGYIADTFWPTVVGQFGWIGFVLFLSAIVCLVMSVCRSEKGDWADSISALVVFLYFLIASSGEPAFFSSYAVYLAFCLGLLVKRNLSYESGKRHLYAHE